jgi:hypothetical protein
VNRSDGPERRRPEWAVVKEYTHPETDIVVRVTKDMASKWPKFNMEIGKKRQEEDDDRLLRRLPMFLDRTDGKVRSRHNLTDIVGGLIDQAEEYVLDEAQRQEDEFQQRRQSREQSASRPGGYQDRQPRQVMRKGKTERTRQKRAQARRNKEEGI